MPSATTTTLTTTPWTSAPKTRARTIQRILEDWDYLTDPTAGRGFQGDGGSVPLLKHEPRCFMRDQSKTGKPKPARCTCSYRSVAELERLIHQMRDTHHGPIEKWTAPNGDRLEASPRRLWWHLNAWYLDARTASFVPPATTAKNKRKKHLARQPTDDHGIPLRHVRVYRNPQASHPIALQAIQWLADNWALQTEPMLPSELLAA